MYQRAFAVRDQVIVHVRGREAPVVMSIDDAGTRSRFYRRVRPNGEKIDDIEASLAEVEAKSRAPLAELIGGAPVNIERKGALSQFFAVQLMRGPAFFEHRRELLVPMLNALEADDFEPAGLALVNNDVDAARARLIQGYLAPTRRFMTMLIDRLLSRARRVRNAVLHGNDTVPATVESVEPFVQDLCHILISQQLHALRERMTLAQVLAEDRDRVIRSLEHLRRGEAPDRALFDG